MAGRQRTNGPRRRPARLLGRQTAVPSCRAEQRRLLDLEQAPGVAGKLAELRPFPDIRTPARRDAGAVIPVHGVNAGLQPVMLGAQADERRRLQAPRVETWLQPCRLRRCVVPPSSRRKP